MRCCILAFFLILTVYCGTAMRPLNVNIGTFAMERTGGYGIIYYLFPAYDMGVADVRALYGNYLNVTHTYVSKPWITSCNPLFLENVEDMVAKFYYETAPSADITVLLSPGCTEGYSTSILATQWDILHISTGSDTGFRKSRSANPVWLTLATGSSTNVRDALVELLLMYKWFNVYLLLDSASNPVAQGILIAVQEALGKMAQVQVTFRAVNATSDTPQAREGLLADFRRYNRIMLYFGHSDYFRKVLIQAAKMNMTNGDFIYIGFQALFHMGIGGNFSWEYGDAEDEPARQAYRSVLLLGAVHLDNQTEADRDDPFLQQARQRTYERYNTTYKEPSPFMRTAYASMLMLGEVLAETFAEDPLYNFLRGKNLADKFLNRTFTNRIMDVSISPTGEIVVNLTLRATSITSGRLEVVKIWDGLRHRYVDVEPLTWPNGESPPLNIPVCGYLGNAPSCAPGFRYGAVVGAVVGVVSALILCSMLLLVCIKRRAARALLNDRSWLITDDSLGRAQESQFNMTKSRHTRTPNDTYVQLWYRGIPAWTSRMYTYVNANTYQMLTKSFDHDFQIFMYEARECSHSNINRFFGLHITSVTASQYSINAVTALCVRGSICDLFEAREVDWEFRISFVNNLLAGAAFIHSGPLGFHGRLSSKKCLLDRHFTLKISDYGYTQMMGNIEMRVRTHRFDLHGTNSSSSKVSRPFRLTKENDILAIGILIAEIVTACVLSAEELFAGLGSPVSSMVERAIRQVIQGNSSMKPRLDKILPQLINLIHRCLEKDPRLRPSVAAVSSELDAVFQTDRDRSTVIEKTLMRLSVYSERLENEIATRTQQLLSERQKSDKLLQELLPPVMVDSLRRGGYVPAEIFAATTVFFSDISGFPFFIDSHPPLQTLQTLSSIFRILDYVILKFKVYKVETTGDSYMVVSGLPIRHKIHADEIVSMGCLMHQMYYSSEYHLRHDLDFRAGAHSGTCAAGIVGLNRPRYCLFGDTVNVASRMCTAGEGGRLHASAHTVALLAEEFADADVVLRGTISVKGRGEMVTYWIDPRHMEME